MTPSPLAMCKDGVGGFWFSYSQFVPSIGELGQLSRVLADDTLCSCGTGTGAGGVRGRIVPDGTGGVIAAYPISLDIDVLRVDGGASIQPLYRTTLVVPLVSGGEQNWDMVPDTAGGAIVVVRNATSAPQAFRIAPDGSLPWGGTSTSDPGLEVGKGPMTVPRAVPDLTNGAIVVWSKGDDLHAARADRHRYVGHPRPHISQVEDVPADQGGSILVTWDPSPLDVYPYQEITQYSIWRQAADAARTSTPVTSTALRATQRMGFDPGTARELLGAGWEPVATVPAGYEERYAFETPTYADSTVQGPAPMNVKVFAQTTNPFVYWKSGAEVGQSVDNLAPGAPLNATAGRGGTVTTLTWEAPAAPDLAFYRVYRGQIPDFVPDVSTFLVAVTGTEWVDLGSGIGFFYKITTVDDAWNESDPATPEDVTGTPAGTAPARFALHRNWPNPFNPLTHIRFDLASGSDRVGVHVYDAAGRLVRTLHAGALPAGSHTLDWDGRDDSGRELGSGAYYLELDAGSERERMKMIMLR